MSGIHDGHRERVRKQFLSDGFSESTPPHKVLELLLFYAIPRKDTNELAHTLIEKFGSFSGVLDAPVTELVKISGITEKTACLIKLILPTARMYDYVRSQGISRVNSYTEAAEYLLNKFKGRTVETVFLLCLDNKGKVLSCSGLSEGDENSVSVSVRTIVQQALKSGATSVMLGHNHPRGFAVPSQADLTKTAQVAKALYHIGVELLDHIIVSDGEYISLRRSKEYSFVFETGE